MTLVGLHVHRCGGSALLAALEKQIAPLFIHQCTSLHRNWRQGRPQFLEISRPAHLRAVFGHWVHEEMLCLLPNAFLFTFIRDPAERLRSHYGYAAELRRKLGQPVPAAEEWLGWSGPDPVCRFFVERFPSFAGIEGELADRAIATLDAFDMVCTTETAPAGLAELGRRLGAPLELDRCNALRDVPRIDFDASWIAGDQRFYDEIGKRFTPIQRRCHRRQELCARDTTRHRLAQFLYQAERDELESFGVLKDAEMEAKTLADLLLAKARHFANLRTRD